MTAGSTVGHRLEVQPTHAATPGRGHLKTSARLRAISQATAQYVSWASGIYDFDNDGLLDILMFHGGLMHMVPQEQSLYRGLGNAKFADVSREAGPVLDVKTVSRGACFADYDNDGKMDAFVVNLGAGNVAAQRFDRTQIIGSAFQLEDTKSNRDGIGRA